ncbi:MAG: hypothetical protein WC243_02625 [Patescibacteria group bacterium]
MDNQAVQILDDRRPTNLILTAEFAIVVNEVVRKLPPDTPCRDLRYGANPQWEAFRRTITVVQRAALTRALGCVATAHSTVEQVSKKSIRELEGRKATKVTAAFLYLAFRLQHT